MVTLRINDFIHIIQTASFLAELLIVFAEMLAIMPDRRQFSNWISKKKGLIFMKQLQIVLVEPQIPQNTGNIARTCAVTGASLHLIQPMGFTVTDKHLKRAGLDYWHQLDITYYDNWADFAEKHAAEQDTFYFFTTKGKQIHSDAAYTKQDSVFLIFGREDQGLPEPLLHEHAAQCVRIPMRHTLRSLNLSNSVAIATYEVLRQWHYPDLQCASELDVCTL
jgi:tRNA (cytidine/uridine-2'-O-)-methyltransferase